MGEWPAMWQLQRISRGLRELISYGFIGLTALIAEKTAQNWQKSEKNDFIVQSKSVATDQNFAFLVAKVPVTL